MTDSFPRVRAVLYDFDGTLADSTELIMRCYRHTMRTHLGECPPDEAWLAGFGTPLETQIALEARIPDEFRLHAHHWLILHGRYICKARKPECWRCPINDLCRYPDKTLA